LRVNSSGNLVVTGTTDLSNVTVSGTVTGTYTLGGTPSLAATALTGTVAVARLGSSGTASSTTFLRGDNAWAAVTERLIQSAFVYKQDTFTTTSTSYVDVTGLSVSITPTSASNYIIILGAIILSNSSDMGAIQLVRGSTPIQVGTAAGSRYSATHDFRCGFDSALSMSVTLAYRDLPSTTSSVTYKIQAMSRNSGTTRINMSGDDADQTNRGRFASTILLLEVAP